MQGTRRSSHISEVLTIEGQKRAYYGLTLPVPQLWESELTMFVNDRTFLKLKEQKQVRWLLDEERNDQLQLMYALPTLWSIYLEDFLSLKFMISHSRWCSAQHEHHDSIYACTRSAKVDKRWWGVVEYDLQYWYELSHKPLLQHYHWSFEDIKSEQMVLAHLRELM